VNGVTVLASGSGVNAFHIIGGCLALWAVIVAVLGIVRDGFPFGDRGGRVVGLITAALVLAAMSSAVLSASSEEETGEAAAAEGGGNAPSGSQKLELSADPSGQLKFDKTKLSGKAGAVTIEMKNPSDVPHNVSLEGNGVNEEGKTVKKGEASTVSSDLKPGEYTFYCSVPGHRQGGMDGTLTVK